jgi:choline dehydrogenase-like flavoprotein
MEVVDFVIVGSSGGGGTIAWVLAKAGFNITILEMGTDLARPLDDDKIEFNPQPHDEHRFRVEKPDPKRRLRGDYNTFRLSEADVAKPFKEGWTGTSLGGGSVIWGGWSFRALPIDFVLETHFKQDGQLDQLKSEGYSIKDWPISYNELEPYYNVAETLLAVSGDRDSVNKGVTESPWFKNFSGQPHFDNAGNWQTHFPFPCQPYPLTPVGKVVQDGMTKLCWNTLQVPVGIVAPGTGEYETRQKIAEALSIWGDNRPEFWQQSAAEIWSDRKRDACNMCGFCGEYLCWGKEAPKSGTRASTLKEMAEMENVQIITDAKAYEVVYDARLRRATGVRYLDISDPDHPKMGEQKAHNVIVSCGAVQSARLLLMSGAPAGLGNSSGQLGRNITFHLFGLSATAELPEEYQGLLQSQFGYTGNTMSFDNYFIRGEKDHWLKAGTMVSTAKKNPLENALSQSQKGFSKIDLLKKLESYTRTVELRLTGDDLPMTNNRVDLDPKFVDEYGFPAARITRNFGPNELRMFKAARPLMEEVFRDFKEAPGDPVKTVKSSDATVTLAGDHQMGTCRMGDDPTQSVVDRYCRLHDVPNVYVVDSSFMPTGLGLNPMVTVVANALRVGTWIVEQSKYE